MSPPICPRCGGELRGLSVDFNNGNEVIVCPFSWWSLNGLWDFYNEPEERALADYRPIYARCSGCTKVIFEGEALVWRKLRQDEVTAYYLYPSKAAMMEHLL